MRMMSWLVACVVVSAFGGSARAADAPYLGAWDCGVATFWFTPNGYDNGSEILPVRKVTKDKGAYILSFDKGYKIGLSGVTRDKMSWLSMESGDGFECKRVR